MTDSPPVSLPLDVFIKGSPRNIRAAIANANAKTRRVAAAAARASTNFAPAAVPDPRGNRREFFRRRGYRKEPLSEIERHRRKQLARIITRRRTASRKAAHSRASATPPSLGDKLIYYTEGNKHRQIKLKDISFDDERISLLRAEEIDWLMRYHLSK